ncbi:6-pyruvoyl trahydropterin synthase family protein [Streptomyces sp. NPDC087440]|uniref:6-pyruvoyl trahydropterin synthase family protein n=1 Tax=Streptomyces sp. NPDC087440 TaxID=3365790 RepID=UPI00381D2419
MTRSAHSYRIGKSFRFDATRQLSDGRYDGHAFTAEAVLSSSALSPEGFVADFGDLRLLRKYIDNALDHQILNEAVKDPSDTGLGEHLTKWAQDHLPTHVTAALEAVYVRTGRGQRHSYKSHFVEFEASHRLCGLREGHPCGRLHGHSYVVSAPAAGARRNREVPVLLRSHLRTAVDGQVLNTIFPGFNPTSEHLAQHCVDWLVERGMGQESWGGLCIRVSETETSWAEYTRRTT